MVVLRVSQRLRLRLACNWIRLLTLSRLAWRRRCWLTFGDMDRHSPKGLIFISFAFFLSFMYLICGAFRLARFNVQASRPRVLAEGTIKVDKKSFVGLPIPVAGGLIAALVHFSPAR